MSIDVSQEVEQTDHQAPPALRKSGVYAIFNPNHGKVYIGETTNSFQKRWGAHRADLEAGAHHCESLQEDFDSMKDGQWRYVILETPDQVNQLLQQHKKVAAKKITESKEQYYWLLANDTIPGGTYNGNPYETSERHVDDNDHLHAGDNVTLSSYEPSPQADQLFRLKAIANRNLDDVTEQDCEYLDATQRAKQLTIQLHELQESTLRRTIVRFLLLVLLFFVFIAFTPNRHFVGENLIISSLIALPFVYLAVKIEITRRRRSRARETSNELDNVQAIRQAHYKQLFDQFQQEQVEVISRLQEIGYPMDSIEPVFYN